ncbi:MAG: hypothetical protein SAK29_21620 [Scytonema sp. PMC 1069.18]|nr:hypothetical protein [Scytonema sp. PMC 1069.18]MEC4884458.1 hypothetical protein [Scytonema sp. PMC 1070.18]
MAERLPCVYAIAFLLCLPFSPTAVGKIFGFVDANFSWLYLCLTVLALPFAYKLGWSIRRFSLSLFTKDSTITIYSADNGTD